MEQGQTAAVAAAREAIAARRAAEHALHDAVARVEAEGAAAAGGYRSTAGLLGDVLRVDRSEATRLLARAECLIAQPGLSGEPLAPVWPASAAASAAGVVGEGHLAVIARTMTHLARVPGLDPDALGQAEVALVEAAGRLAPAGLARVAQRLVNTLDPDGAAPEEESEPVDELHLVRRRDGSLVLKGRIRGRGEAEVVLEVFDALGAPAGADDPRSRAQRDAEVLVELCGLAASPTGIATDTRTHQHDTTDTGGDEPGTDADTDADADEPGTDTDADADADAEETGADEVTDAPGSDDTDRPGSSDEPAAGTGDPAAADAADAGLGLWDGLPSGARARRAADRCGQVTVSGRALVAVTIDHQWLQKQLGYGLLDSEQPLDPAAARRMACDAGIVPVVLGARSEPLDVGRLSYTVPEAIRRALHLRDGGCSFPGCTRRPRRCHAHHVRHWISGGPTEIDNLTLLCGQHHRLIHHDHWQITMIDRRPWYRPPAWVDPDQRLRPGGRHPLPTTTPA